MSARVLNDFELKLIDNVRAHGCQVNTVFDPEGDDPAFSYSIGFAETIGQPEVIVFGLDGTLMHSMINETLRQCRDGMKLEDGSVIDGLLEGFACVARQVHPDWIAADYFNSAMWHHKYRTGTALQHAMQIVWPGAVDRLYPWDAGSDPYVQSQQPALYQPRFDA